MKIAILSPTIHFWLRLVALAIGIATILGELGFLLLISLSPGSQQTPLVLNLLMPGAGIVVGVLTCLFWYFSKPWEQKTLIQTNQQTPLPLVQTGEISELDNRQEEHHTQPVEPLVRSLEVQPFPAETSRASGIVPAPTEPFIKQPRLVPERAAFLTHFRVYTLSKEGDVNQDSCFSFKSSELCRFAVTDGVGGSFLPGKWAEIVARNFSNLAEDLTTAQKCVEWLSACSDEWQDWADQEWIPRANQLRGSPYDWSNDRERGAETTLIGCSYSPLVLTQTGHTNILVTAVGDATFFLVRQTNPPDGRWQYQSFALQASEDFNSHPQTLPSMGIDTQKVWRQVKQKLYSAHRGDYLFLTTDALAKWILLQIKQGFSPWEKLLGLTSSEAFGEFVLREREHRFMDRDDTTMMVVPLF